LAGYQCSASWKTISCNYLLLISALHVCSALCTFELVPEPEASVSTMIVLKRSLAQPGNECSGCSHTRAAKSDSRCQKAHHSQASESCEDAGCWSEGPVCPALEGSGQGTLRIVSYHLHLPEVGGNSPGITPDGPKPRHSTHVTIMVNVTHHTVMRTSVSVFVSAKSALFHGVQMCLTRLCNPVRKATCVA
jgi:hypothetical protein